LEFASKSQAKTNLPQNEASEGGGAVAVAVTICVQLRKNSEKKKRRELVMNGMVGRSVA